MKVTVFGAGYVGLVQGAVFADAGHDVLCIDTDNEKIERLKKGEIPIYEPGLKALVDSNTAQGRLKFSNVQADGVKHGLFQFLAVGTPPKADGSVELQYVIDVATAIGKNISDYKIVVNKSTVPVGTTDLVKRTIEKEIKKANRKIDFDVVSNPEFLKEGAAISDCKKPDRIIIGTNSQRAIEELRELYAPFNRNHEKMIIMDARSAELTKYAANSMLATKISFMNEISGLAEKMGADIESVRKGIGSDPRIGYDFIYAGLGYGGSCFPKDIKALVCAGEKVGFDTKILKAVEYRNQEQKSLMLQKILHKFDGKISGLKFAVWGLSFKPKTDDMREAASRYLLEGLWKEGAYVRAYDPEAMKEAKKIYGNRPDFELVSSKESVLQDCDALILVTEWPEFQSPDFDLVKKMLKTPLIFDGRNIFDPRKMKERGFSYISMGRN